MLAAIYLIASMLVGAVLVFLTKPAWENRLKVLFGNEKIISPSFLFFPAIYLTGTLVLSWITYFLAVAFAASKNPLLYANLTALLLTAVLIGCTCFYKRDLLKKWFSELRKYGLHIRFSWQEWTILIGSALFWSIFIIRSLYAQGEVLHAGVSAFSDFGAHFPVIRSFSRGSNFPAQYPHFPDGTMRYHFMFYFMAGNLEFLGFNFPLALNLPSILSLICFSMLLYSLGAALTKKPLAGLVTCGLFAFRSSFAFFTYSKGFESLRDFIHALANNLNVDGSGREHIGSTMNESWGLWAQKVYVNQRHLAFAFGLFILVMFLLLPLFVETVEKLKNVIKKDHPEKKPENSFVCYLKSILFTPEAWLPQSYAPCILAGLLLGMMAFWNGAVVITGISILFVMAALSRHKIEYLITAVITFLLSTMQSRLFVGSGTGAVSFKYEPGFLAQSDKLGDIFSYFAELLGILPFMLLGVFLVFIPKDKNWLRYAAAIVFILPLIIYLPSVGLVWSFVIIGACAAFFLYIATRNDIQMNALSPWLIPVFLGPIILASTLQLTPDITVNHKYIIFAMILLNIPVSDLLTNLFEKRSVSARVIAGGMFLMLTLTGIVDLITLYNLDKNSVTYNQAEPVQVWVQDETDPNAIFLTHYMTHYNAPMSIFLAGRSVYNGYPYFTVTAGYDIDHRGEVMTRIYSAEDPQQLRELAISEGIDYIVIEEQNRSANEYTLNEEVFYNTFPVAFEDTGRQIVIFKVE